MRSGLLGEVEIAEYCVTAVCGSDTDDMWVCCRCKSCVVEWLVAKRGGCLELSSDLVKRSVDDRSSSGIGSCSRQSRGKKVHTTHLHSPCTSPSTHTHTYQLPASLPAKHIYGSAHNSSFRLLVR